MVEDLKPAYSLLKEATVARGFVIYPQVPAADYIYWEGDPLPFLDLARQVGVGMVYLEEFPLMLPLEPYLALQREFDQHEVVSAEEKDWMVERVSEALQPWKSLDGSTRRFQCVWYHNAAAHCYERDAEWHEEITRAADEAVEQCQRVRAENRSLVRQEDTNRLYELGKQMCKHPRFPEATSEAKRLYMARQLFPAEDEHRRIAEYAMLYHWWYVEPGERTTKAAKAYELYHEQGETIKNIAVVLKMSEAKVKEAVETYLPD